MFQIVDVPEVTYPERTGRIKEAYLEAVRIAKETPSGQRPKGVRLDGKTLKSARSRISELNRKLGGGLSVMGRKDESGSEYIIIFKRGDDASA